MTLRELEIGDFFYAKSDKTRRERFHVLGKPEFNSGFGSATRQCMNLLLKSIQNKSCRLEVIKFEKK